MVSKIERYSRARRRKVPLLKFVLPKLLRTKVSASKGIPESKLSEDAKSLAEKLKKLRKDIEEEAISEEERAERITEFVKAAKAAKKVMPDSDLDQQIQDVHAVLEKRATKEEMEESDAKFDMELQLAETAGKVQKAQKEQDLQEQIEAEVALDDLERAMKTLEKEEKEAKAARERVEKAKEAAPMVVPADVSPEELKTYEAALEEYGRKIGKDEPKKRRKKKSKSLAQRIQEV